MFCNGRHLESALCISGYLTEALLEDSYSQFYADYPEVEKATLKKQYQRAWKVLYNNGKDVPPGNYTVTCYLIAHSAWSDKSCL